MATFVRDVVTFPIGDDQIEAWHYRPGGAVLGPAGARPVVVMGHGLGGTKDMGLAPYAERFCAAGYHCLVFDYRGFGGSTGLPRRIVSVSRQLEDWQAAVAHARTLDGVDPDRVVVWGTSLGGGHALATAAQDAGLAAAIAQCPLTDGVASSLAVPLRTTLRLGARAVADLWRARTDRAPLYVDAAGAPGELALMSTQDSLDGYTRLAEAAGTTREEARIGARAALDILRYTPGRDAAAIACPLFVVLCEDDTVAPSRTAFEQVTAAPRASIARYRAGHFDVYRGETFDQVMSDCVAFLDAHVPAAPA